jgi:hypothetical protein
VLPRIQYAKSDGVQIAYQVVGAGLLDLVYLPAWELEDGERSPNFETWDRIYGRDWLGGGRLVQSPSEIPVGSRTFANQKSSVPR